MRSCQIILELISWLRSHNLPLRTLTTFYIYQAKWFCREGGREAEYLFKIIQFNLTILISILANQTFFFSEDCVITTIFKSILKKASVFVKKKNVKPAHLPLPFHLTITKIIIQHTMYIIKRAEMYLCFRSARKCNWICLVQSFYPD